MTIELRSMRMVLVITLLLCLLLPSTSFSFECTTTSSMYGLEYWLRNLNGIVTESYDTDEDRIFKLVYSGKKCSSAKLSEINDERERLVGYKETLRLLIGFRGNDPYKSDWINRKKRDVRPEIKRLTGIYFENLDDAREWWNENKEFLYVANDSELLVVDEEAKRSNRPIIPYFDISAKHYWRYATYRHIRELKEDEVFIYGVVPGDHYRTYKRVKKSTLENRQDKEDAYIEIVDKYIFEIIRDRSLLNRQQNEDAIARVLDKYIFQSNSDRSADKSPNFMSVPSRLTGKEFETAKEWIDWWTLNKDKLVLSEDGTMLVTK